MRKRSNEGFTLVEILVVIAIIGILAVVAVPALFKNIEKAKVSELEADISAIRSAALSNYSDESQATFTGGIMWVKDKNGNVNTIIGHTPSGEIIDKTPSHVEGISIPFGGIYELYEHNYSQPGKVMLQIGNISISNSALEKLKLDLGDMIDEKSNNQYILIKLIDKNK